MKLKKIRTFCIFLAFILLFIISFLNNRVINIFLFGESNNVVITKKILRSNFYEGKDNSNRIYYIDTLNKKEIGSGLKVLTLKNDRISVESSFQVLLEYIKEVLLFEVLTYFVFTFISIFSFIYRKNDQVQESFKVIYKFSILTFLIFISFIIVPLYIKTLKLETNLNEFFTATTTIVLFWLFVFERYKKFRKYIKNNLQE